MNEMKDRIRQIMEAQQMTQQSFANFIGLSTASLSSIFNDRTKPTLNTVEAIKKKFPNINIGWLMFGEGSMYDDENKGSDRVAEDNGSRDNEQSLNFASESNDLFNRPAESRETSLPPRQVHREVKTEIKYIEKPQRQITEIRVYFDDLTYESFVPKK